MQPWLYFNIVLRNSQIFLPVLDLVRLSRQLQCMYVGRAAALHETKALVCKWLLVYVCELP